MPGPLEAPQDAALGSLSGPYIWLRDKVISFFNANEDVFQRLLGSDARIAITSFVENAEATRLLIFSDGKDITAAIKPPKAKNKLVYFVKMGKVVLDKDNISSMVLCGDLGESPLEVLSAFSSEVALPLLHTLVQHGAWPDATALEVTDTIQNFAAGAYIALGHTRGQKLLPVPGGMAEARKPHDRLAPTVGPGRINEGVTFLEATANGWMHAIKDILNNTPEMALQDVEGVGPLSELDFWADRAVDLNSLTGQLASQRVQQVVQALAAAGSTYAPALERLMQEVETARVEAADNAKFLAPLRKPLQHFTDTDDVSTLSESFTPLFHVLLLVWQHSGFYNTAARMVPLLRLIVDDLIAHLRGFTPGPELLRVEPAEAAEKLQVSLRVLSAFTACYDEYRVRSMKAAAGNPWRFGTAAVLGHLQVFSRRLSDLADMCTSALHFSRLERIEVGGSAGKEMTLKLRVIHTEAAAAFARVQALPYDPLDAAETAFVADCAAYQSTKQELERRLAAIISQAYDQSGTFGGAMKALDGFEGLLEHGIIAADVRHRTSALLTALSLDLAKVSHEFRTRKGAPELGKNAAPHSGTVAWLRSLRGRITEPMEKAKALGRKALQTEEGQRASEHFERLMAELAEYEAATVADWCQLLSETSDQKLKQPLLRIEQENGMAQLAVSFDPALVRLLREVRYFLMLPQLSADIPETAIKVHQRADSLRAQISALEKICHVYNGVQRTLLPIEKPLVQAKLDALDAALQGGLAVLTWNSHTVDERISATMALVVEADELLKKIESVERRAHDLAAKWSAQSLFERHEGQVASFKELQAQFKAGFAARSTGIREGGRDMARILAETLATLGTLGRASPAWTAYTRYIADIVVAGLRQSALVSLRYLRKLVEPQAEHAPLLEVKLELFESEIRWVPEVSAGTDSGVRAMLDSWIVAFQSVGSLVSRLDADEGDYTMEVKEGAGVADVSQQIVAGLAAAEAEAEVFRRHFTHFSHLWTTPLQDSLQDFLEREGMLLEDGRREAPPLVQFEVKIAQFRSLEEDIAALPSTPVLGFVRADARPLKQALIAWISKWIFLYTQCLQHRVLKSTEELFAFMAASSATLDLHVDPADSAEPPPHEDAADLPLYKIMACICAVQKRAERTEASFGPLHDMVALLVRYNISTDEDVLRKLDEAPNAWKALCKKKLLRKEELSYLQQAEAIKVRRASDAFQARVEAFRMFFQKTAPFATSSPELSLADVKEAYAMIEAFGGSGVGEWPGVGVMLAEAAVLRKHQELFELHASDYLLLTRCQEELGYLRALWEMVERVLSKFGEWYTTLWDKINVDQLLEHNKALSKDVKTLNKAVRVYDVYGKLEGALKAMQTSLPLVNELHHPAMRPRHWKQLMRATGVHFEMNESFSLGGLMALGLHKYVDACSEIVDRAEKELSIENALKKIEDTWAALSLVFTPYQDSSVMQMVVDEAITEALEADNIVLQNMASSKYVQANDFFLEKVTAWQRQLGAVDAVLGTWGDVQKKWQALESIFIGSADIRVQLPDDSRRFDIINANFQELMKEAPAVTNVVEACGKENRQLRLDALLEQLEMCEKALQDYLETKRMAFPRFYFVAPADLLDILSKGSDPQAILRHLPKNFDNVHNLEFRKDFDGNPTKSAIGMYSGEGEYVPFAADCLCEGPVEVWLQNVVDAMQAALSAEFKAAVPAYEEKPRTKWIFENSVQTTITVSRTFFTQEVNEAFGDMEDGNEDALKDMYERQVSQLSDLIEIINGDLSKNDRKKLITLCTIDVHARDVVHRLIEERVESAGAFQWQSQLRYTQHDKTKECQVNICDAEIAYNYEYIGNCGCLCITPLTDRCYITLTQAQRLILGGAPAGPAGTGKTETTKDLARALGVQCYVFNCSDQMDFRAMGQIYKGLAQTGAWGCFDEFNRIPVAVLSVCSTQYKTVLDALRARKERLMFEGSEIRLKPTAMAFITMNPGYPGRAELPESLKALFRPVSMCVPDLNLICEIMLMAEGFQQSKLLSRKFVILYKLCEDLLSKSKHYDWKLRAIKTTLYVAGGMKRQAPDLSEDKVLLRALRDFNFGKLTADDMGIFMGLLKDLFPKTVELVPRAVDQEFEAKVREAAQELGYQPDETFCLKVSQLREIFAVRWSVFLLGPAGCGKTAIWRTLMRAQQLLGERTVYKPINPKAVTRNELYGYLHPTAREWKEGLISVTYRDMANNKTNKHQWLLLDGDIDAEWIESMNTVMDDNKMLTLASNERIPLAPSMRLLLEINHMDHCSPATVSRGGVIYVNAEDVGWRPPVESWLQSLEAVEYRPILSGLFDKYVEATLQHCRRNFKTVTPLPAVSQAMTICHILEGILPKESVRGVQPDTRVVETCFVFACIWGLGGAMAADKSCDYRTAFSSWWTAEWKTIPFPDKGLVYDYYVDEATGALTPWEDRVPKFTYTPGNFSNLFVPTVETTRISYFLDSLIANKHHVMLVGSTGSGKTAIMRKKLQAMDADAMSHVTINLNSFSDAPSLQPILEQPLEKKSGMRFDPPGSKRLVYFVDDMNMPFVDKYDTQSAIELMRQSIDYKGWFDKVKVVMKEVVNTQYVACMNPTAGSFHITPRMQRHFATFAVQMPSADITRSICSAIIEGHLQQGSFTAEVAAMGPKLVDATLELHRNVMNNFTPSAVKFHYQFNLRELSAITQGLCQMAGEHFRDRAAVVRLWVHECERVLSDRLVSDADIAKFREFRINATRKYFDDVPQVVVEARPLLMGSFMEVDAEDRAVYAEVASYDALKATLVAKLAEYNESNPGMDLVFFQQAIEHVCRIARIIAMPGGNAMLVGVGGSGKQSLARLAAFLCGYEVFQVSVSSTYGVADFKEDLLGLYQKAGVKGIQMAFLLTDNQIVNEKCLVYINDFLSTGYIADICSPEDKENFSNSVRSEVKATGLLDTPDNCWEFFIEKVRRNLHVVLCFSPVGDKFRIRARQFPALVNCVTFDWFHTWPPEALVSVAKRFLLDIPDVEDSARESLAQHMAFAHLSVAEESKRYLEGARRYNYTTPKSYLELISLYKSLLAQKRTELKANKERLENGVDKIAQASAQVAHLQIALKEEQIIVEEKKATTQALIENIGKEKAVVDEAVETSRDDEEAAAKLQAEVTAFQDECTRDLEVAEPVIREAEAALNSLDKASLGELKSFGSPAAEVINVVSACMVLTAPGGKIPKDLSWAAGKKFMGNVDAFLKMLLTFNKDAVPVPCVEKVEKDFISNLAFNADSIRTKSGAAAGLCSWVINICKYFRIYQVVAPKRAALAEANRKLSEATRKLSTIRARVKELQDRVASLEDSLTKATQDKNSAMAQAERTAAKAKLAERLINGLSGEFQRWTATIKQISAAEGKLVGDVLLAAAFVSYAGPFNMSFRQRLVHEKWLPDLQQRAIPCTPGIMPLDILSSDTKTAKWAQEGLQTDALSVENGTIISAAARWPLLIDPQLQGIKWIIGKEAPNGLRIIQQSEHNYIDKVIHCIEQGLPLLIENLPEEIDAVMDSVIGKRTTKRGRQLILKLGDKEVEYNPNFRLYLATKLANPHYRPEIAAQTTLVNFCVTEEGLEEQLLAAVVKHERPDLQEAAAALVRQLADYTIMLTSLEDNLLARLANSQGDILEDTALIENLEETKRTALDIAEKVSLAKETGEKLGRACEVYRPVATRSALIYFSVDALSALNRVYRYSMANFTAIMRKGMDITPGGKDESSVPVARRLNAEVTVAERVQLLISTITFTVYSYISQGLVEQHKLIVGTQLCMAVLKRQGSMVHAKFDYLLRGPKTFTSNQLKEWVPDSAWAAMQALKDVEGYAHLPDDLAASAKRWQEWLQAERPEDEPLPGDWKRMPQFDQLLLFRALRPDRLTAAMRNFVSHTLGKDYAVSQPFSLEASFQDSGPSMPILVFLSPGVDVAASVEALGRKLGFTKENGNFAVVSLGQGQEPIAMVELAAARKNGSWVLLQNIHLTIDWTSGPLEKIVDKLGEDSHPDFRLFLSAEPPPLLERPLPISLLQNSIKLTNEPPEGLKANLKRAYSQFTEDIMEGCAKQTEFRAIVFALCFFHASILERKKFGVGNLPGATSGIGWNMNYPFNTGDLICCGQCAANYLDNNAKVPWEDLRYIFGEIMYGGHIVEDWDRRLAAAYLSKYFNEGLLEASEHFPALPSPPSSLSTVQVLEYIEDNMPPESASAYGLHPNAEVGFKRREAGRFCLSLALLQPREDVQEGGLRVEEKAKIVLDDVLDRLPEAPRMDEIRSRVNEPTPYTMVALQETERMVALLMTIRRSLAELDLGLKGDLTMSESMEKLMYALASDTVPQSWALVAYPSLRSLSSWLNNLVARAAQLSDWTSDFTVPKSVWLSGLFNPQSFLTAVMQTTARKNDWSLDKTVIVTEVTKKTVEQIDAPSRDGAFVHGLFLEGARWDDKTGALEDSHPKELTTLMPVMLIRAIPADRADMRDTYQCPVYTTEARFRQEVFTAQLKTKQSWVKWTMAGVCLFLDVA